MTVTVGAGQETGAVSAVPAGAGIGVGAGEDDLLRFVLDVEVVVEVEVEVEVELEDSALAPEVAGDVGPGVEVGEVDELGGVVGSDRFVLEACPPAVWLWPADTPIAKAPATATITAGTAIRIRRAERVTPASATGGPAGARRGGYRGWSGPA